MGGELLRVRVGVGRKERRKVRCGIMGRRGLVVNGERWVWERKEWGYMQCTFVSKVIYTFCEVLCYTVHAWVNYLFIHDVSEQSNCLQLHL